MRQNNHKNKAFLKMTPTNESESKEILRENIPAKRFNKRKNASGKEKPPLSGGYLLTYSRGGVGVLGYARSKRCFIRSMVSCGTSCSEPN